MSISELKPAELNSFRQFIYSIHPISDSTWDEFQSHWEVFNLKRKTLITRSGETERYLYFVLSGVQHAFYVTEEGKELSIVFTYPYSFSGVADSFLTQTPSLYSCETLSSSKLLRCEYNTFMELVEIFPEIKTLILKSLSRVLKGALERQIELQCFNAEQKFSTLLKRSPQVFQLIPHKYLASYLGMDAATFSKLLSKH